MSALDRMFRRHQFTVTVKRIFTFSRITFPNILRLYSDLASKIDQSGLRRISNLHTVYIGRIVAENAADKKQSHIIIFGIDLVCRNS